MLRSGFALRTYTSYWPHARARRRAAALWSMAGGAAAGNHTPAAMNAVSVEKGVLVEGAAEMAADSEQPVNGTSSPTWKWRLVLAYDGSKYSGWQLQDRDPTIQFHVEDALMKLTRLTRKELKVIGAGRTDAGVHAWGQVAQFTTLSPFEELGKVHVSLNGILPHDIRVREVSAVHPSFHARYSALSKTYHYKAYVSPVMDPFQRGHTLYVIENLNVEVMQEAAQNFVGTHDFSAFANASDDAALQDPVRTIFKFNVNAAGPEVCFVVEGTGFFYKQVRNMVGLLIEIGKELVPPRAVVDVIASKSRKALASVARTAPPQGLYLMSVSYDEAALSPVEEEPRASHGTWKQPPKAAVYKLPCSLVVLSSLLLHRFGFLKLIDILKLLYLMLELPPRMTPVTSKSGSAKHEEVRECFNR